MNAKSNGKPIPLALVCTGLAVGGAEKNLVRIACGLDRDQWAPTVVSLQPRPPREQAGLVAKLEDHDLRPTFLDLENWRNLPRAVAGLKRKLQEENVAIVQSFLYHANVLSAWAGRAVPTELVTGIRVAGYGTFRQRMERWAGGRATRVACVSHAIADYAESTLGIDANKLVTITNAVDVPSPEVDTKRVRASIGATDSSEILLCVGRLEYQKGIDRLLDIAPQILQPAERHLVVIGSGANEAEYQQRAAKLECGDRVHWLGWRPDFIDWMVACDLYLLPSRWEGMPNVVLEAMACGRAVAAMDVEGVADALGPQARAQTVAADDVESFRCLVERLLSSPQERTSLGAKNREYTQMTHSVQQMVGRYESLYRAVLDGEQLRDT